MDASDAALDSKPSRTFWRHANRRFDWGRLAIILGVFIGVVIYVWEEHLEDQIVPRNFGVVEPGHIYRAGRQTPRTLTAIINKYDIRTLVDMGGYPEDSEREATMTQVAIDLGVEHHEIRLDGHGIGNPNAFVDVLELINDESKHPILVHCAAGSERTGACIAMYRHIQQDLPLADAMEESTQFKHEPDDNPRMFLFVGQWHTAIKRSLETGEWIAGFPTEDVEGWSLVHQYDPDLADQQEGEAVALPTTGEDGE
ncbi:MAG: tyrosine-protein phosphatase [Planctomycetota bacterium]